jgi:signal transduction histidine kinase
LDLNQTAPPLLSTAPTRRADRFVALAIVILSMLGFGALLPYAATPWPRLTAFTLSDDTGLALIYIITGMLLIGQFIQLRTPSMLVLACAYVFAALIDIAHLLSSAAILQAALPRGANGATASLIFVLWHSVFPVFVIAYALLSRSSRDTPIAAAGMLPAIGLGFGGAFALTVLCILIAVVSSQHHMGGGASAVILAAGSWLVTFMAVTILFARSRARRILDLWLCIALFAWLLDIISGELLSQGPYNFGWYAGRIYGLLAAAVVLSALLLETGALYARLNQAIVDMRTQAAALSQSEAALRQAQKMEAIGQLTGGVAHDFNNLLTVIIGSLDMLRHEHGREARALKLTDYAMQAAVRGEKLIKQLLAFSRRQMVNPEVRNPNQLIREFDGLVRRAIGQAVQIDLDLQDDIASVRVDPAQFEAAILNLAVNARDAMDGSGRITIRTRAETAAGAYVTVAVSDTGSGMDAETVSRVFEPFFTTKPVGKGSGLGLSQVYGFANSSGGSVRIESAPGSGTTVRIYLPKTDEEPPRPVSAEPADRPPSGSDGQVVLIVEDDPGVLGIAVETLGELGYGVLTAGDGGAALDLIRGDARIDLLFSDIVIPDSINGVELAVEARRIRPRLPILLTSGYTVMALTDQTPLPDGVEIIPKPYRIDELARKIQTALSG